MRVKVLAASIIYCILVLNTCALCHANGFSWKTQHFFCLLRNKNQYQIVSFGISNSSVVREIAKSTLLYGSPQNISASNRAIYISNAVDKKIEKFSTSRHSITFLSSIHVNFSPWFVVPYQQYIIASALLGSKLYMVSFSSSNQIVSVLDLKQLAISGFHVILLDNQQGLLVRSAIRRKLTFVCLHGGLNLSCNHPYHTHKIDTDSAKWVISRITNNKITLCNIIPTVNSRNFSRRVQTKNCKSAIITRNGDFLFVMSPHGILLVYRWDSGYGYRLIQRLQPKTSYGPDSMIRIGKYIITDQGSFHQFNVYRISDNGDLILVTVKRFGNNLFLLSMAGVS